MALTLPGFSLMVQVLAWHCPPAAVHEPGSHTGAGPPDPVLLLAAVPASSVSVPVLPPLLAVDPP